MIIDRIFKQALETFFLSDDMRVGYIIQPFNRRIIKDGICPTLTTRPEGLKTAIFVVEENKHDS